MGMPAMTLTDENLGSLCLRAQHGDSLAMDEAMAALEPFVQSVCRRYQGRLKRDPALGPDDLIQQGRLSAIRSVKRWGGRDVAPGMYVVMAMRRDLIGWMERAGDVRSAALSFDKPVGDIGEAAGEVLMKHTAMENQDVPDSELETLLDRIPRATGGAGDDYVTLRLRPGRPTGLPDDETLARLARQGRTPDELVNMFGGSRGTIKARLTSLRKSGMDVPRLKREGKPPTAMWRMPWEAKLQIIAEYLNNNPGVGNSRAKTDLGTTYPTLDKARAELARLTG